MGGVPDGCPTLKTRDSIFFEFVGDIFGPRRVPERIRGWELVAFAMSPNLRQFNANQDTCLGR
ncbi:hypothetical protein PoMZ_04086 [Pyricularia oryzae]|uniref:Uncharacterized protein n=1 Tax=Pyricularia oryzae TaxID=318829 RepID=A0A4P7NCH8_PYROR|nr:hypothetical protein PoMZ_04086 [Pyricularia oryzae]